MLFGASEATLPFAGAYFSVYLCGTPFALLSAGMCQFIISQGFSAQAMFSVVLGAVMNIALDPLFIYAFDMGVTGAAVATVLSQMGSCAFVLAFLFGRRPPVRITFSGYDPRVMGRVLAIGFTPFAIIAADNLMIIAMNAILRHYGGPAEGDMLLTCATIAQSFMLVVTMPLGGISSSTQTILSFNYGARKTGRVEEAQKRIFILCAAYTGLMTLVAWTCGGIFSRLFTTDAQITAGRSGPSACAAALVPLGASSTRSWTASPRWARFATRCLCLSGESWSILWRCSSSRRSLVRGRRSMRQTASDIAGPAVSIAVYALAIRRILARRREAA